MTFCQNDSFGGRRTELSAGVHSLSSQNTDYQITRCLAFQLLSIPQRLWDMYKIYFRQAIQMLKQNRFMSVIAILGTALAIMMIMTIIITDEVKHISVAPEANRYRTFFINGFSEMDSVLRRNSSTFGSVRYRIINDYLKDLKTPELVSVYDDSEERMNVSVNASGKKEAFGLTVRSTDANYWKLYSLELLKGRFYTQEEFDSGIAQAVICESEARKLFKGEEPLGQTLEISSVEYRVIGVVKDVSGVFKQAKSSIWIPYTTIKKHENGGYQVALLAKSVNDFSAIYAEVREIEKRYAANNPPKVMTLYGPYNYRVFAAEIGGWDHKDIGEQVKVLYRKQVFILVILLLVPALNLSGISLSRIKKRTAEIGVRKAFGARRYVILVQVLYENFITSLIGGMLGLLLSYVVVFRLKGWLLSVSDGSSIPLETLVSPAIFLAVFLVCLLINLLSAGLPAYRASRVSIANSINQNDK